MMTYFFFQVRGQRSFCERHCGRVAAKWCRIPALGPHWGSRRTTARVFQVLGWPYLATYIQFYIQKGSLKMIMNSGCRVARMDYMAKKCIEIRLFAIKPAGFLPLMLAGFFYLLFFWLNIWNLAFFFQSWLFSSIWKLLKKNVNSVAELPERTFST